LNGNDNELSVTEYAAGNNNSKRQYIFTKNVPMIEGGNKFYYEYCNQNVIFEVVIIQLKS